MSTRLSVILIVDDFASRPVEVVESPHGFGAVLTIRPDAEAVTVGRTVLRLAKAGPVMSGDDPTRARVVAWLGLGIDGLDADELDRLVALVREQPEADWTTHLETALGERDAD